MVVANDLICFQIPAFYHFVFSSREKVRMTTRKGQPPHGGNVSSQGYFQSVWCSYRSLCKVPNLDCTISRTTCKNIIAWIESNAANPSLVTESIDDLSHVIVQQKMVWWGKNKIRIARQRSNNSSGWSFIFHSRKLTKCDDKTVESFQGACHVGVGILSRLEVLLDFCKNQGNEWKRG